jgi:hypothetical protein
VNAQAGGELNTADAYGSVLWLAVPQEILRRIARIDGADRIKPPRARYTLGVVHDQVIYPQRISADLRTSPTDAQLTVSKVKADLFTLAPAPYEHPSLFDVEDGESLDTTADDAADFNPASLILVAYASSHDGGLLGAWWGEAALLDDGRLDWRHIEPLDLTLVAEDRPDLHVVGGQTAKTPNGFSDAPLEETPLGLRNPLIDPVSEPLEPDAATGDGDDES